MRHFAWRSGPRIFPRGANHVEASEAVADRVIKLRELTTVSNFERALERRAGFPAPVLRIDRWERASPGQRHCPRRPDSCLITSASSPAHTKVAYWRRHCSRTVRMKPVNDRKAGGVHRQPPMGDGKLAESGMVYAEHPRGRHGASLRHQSWSPGSTWHQARRAPASLRARAS